MGSWRSTPWTALRAHYEQVRPDRAIVGLLPAHDLTALAVARRPPLNSPTCRTLHNNRRNQPFMNMLIFICISLFPSGREGRTWQPRRPTTQRSTTRATRASRQMRTWQHSGFSVDKSVRLDAGDTAAIERLTQYIVRCPFSLDRIVSLNPDGKVVYRAESRPKGDGLTGA